MKRLVASLRWAQLGQLVRQHDRLENKIDHVTAKIRALKAKLGISPAVIEQEVRERLGRILSQDDFGPHP